MIGRDHALRFRCRCGREFNSLQGLGLHLDKADEHTFIAPTQALDLLLAAYDEAFAYGF